MKIKIILNSNPFFSASASANRWLTLIEGLNKFEVSIQLLIIGNFQSNTEKDNYNVKYYILFLIILLLIIYYILKRYLRVI